MTIARAAELAKLSRLFAAPAADLPFAHRLGGGELRALREAVSNTLYDDARPMLTRVAKASRLLPDGATAKVGEKVFGPLLCAHVASLLAPEHALGVALHMPDRFLAEVAAQLDPRGAPRVVAAIPTERVVAVALVLVERDDHMTLGRFVDYIAAPTISAVIEAIADEAHFLAIAKYVERPARLAELVDLLPAERLRRMVLGAARDAAHWPALVEIAGSLPPAIQRRIADLVIEGLRTGVLDFLTGHTSPHGETAAAH